ncbi:aminotransferase class I/II-fold pyridoxal phosphate-dependent enzyme [Catalinimonas sp. 4WD22]|uniref:trans-sulfuration enzyme family protein n=1 Tax=Catalinimonas locisalis TaxID=3133978 RepID=UPI00310123AE
MEEKLSLETLLMHYGEERSKYEGAVVPPIFQNSLFTFESWEAIDQAYEDRTSHFIYSRGKNPTTLIAERKLALLAGAEKTQLFPSGMGAISAAILHCINAGDHVIAIKNIYGPANNLLTNYLTKKMGIEVTFVAGDKVEDFEHAIRDKTRLIYLESPSSAVFSLQDLKAVADLARSRNIRTIIDNTWATPIFQPALAMGIDMEVHSCSKYIGGHSDVVAGVIMGKAEDIDSIATREYEWLGAKMAPFEAWLILRSLRTLPMRLRLHQENGLQVAAFLDKHPKIRLVRYPGLESFPQYDLGKKQMKGYTGLMSFQLATEDLDSIKAFVNSLKLFKIGVSWGGHESLIYAPAISYLKELSPEQFGAMGISLGDMRISVGLENAQDLIHDLDTALKVIQ